MSDVTAGATVTMTDGFLAFYTEQWPAVTGYAYQLTRDPDLAKDIAQEAFTRLLSRWVSVREPRPYLFHVTTNLARDSWHATTRRERLLGALSRRTDEVQGPDTSVADAVERLPRAQREVVLLFYYSDLKVAEVAAAVRKPEGTVKSLLAEARKRLALALEDPR